MIAFYTDGKDAIKAYDHGTDWQLISEKMGERWFSKWQHDKRASLHNAFNKFVGRELPRGVIHGLCDKLN